MYAPESAYLHARPPIIALADYRARHRPETAQAEG